MLWQIHSGDLDEVIVSDRESLEENIIKTIESENPKALALLIWARRLTGWPDSTTIDELEGADVYCGTEGLLKRFNKFQD